MPIHDAAFIRAYASDVRFARGRAGVAAAMGVLVVAALTGACTKSHGLAPTAASPAPMPCPEPLPRAGSAAAGHLAAEMYGHVPGWLPPGFGLSILYKDHSAIWSDRRCREVRVGVYGDGQMDPAVGDVGQWRVIADANGCGNAVLGRGRCLDYQTKIDHHIITVQMMGLERPQGDRIVTSIA